MSGPSSPARRPGTYPVVGRRAGLQGMGAVAVAAWTQPVVGRERRKRPLPPLPMSIAVATDDEGERIASTCFLAEQVHVARRLLGDHGVRVRWTELRSLPPGHHRLEDADDRDALAEFLRPRRINVMVVARLRDKDDPKRLRMGVRWRLRRDLRHDYVIVAAYAVADVLTHELGHFFGNGHSHVVDNVMSYRRKHPERVAFDARQGAKMRGVVRRHLARKTLVPARVGDRSDDARDSCGED
ncbi:MAG: hypothetical protein AAF928_04490 [Myxococcota bacterium]